MMLTLTRPSVILVLAIAACGGGSGAKDGGGGAGTGGSGGSGAGGSGAGGTSTGGSGVGGSAGSGTGGTGGGAACGGVTCASNQVCTHPSCGGGIAVCIPLGDAGQCPQGYTMTAQCSSGSGPGCIPPPCTPPAPRCVDVAPACLGTPTCGCLPSNVCEQPNGQYGGTCASVSNGSVFCLSAA